MSTCPKPFFSQGDFPSTGGYIKGRYCGNIAPGLDCCLPCPLEDWVYSDQLHRKLAIGFWFNVPALIVQVFLLLTFLVLPEDLSHRHYLSIGLCLSFILAEVAFIIPLGTKPDQCYNAITPDDMHSSMSCAWSGALVIAGAMGAAVWVMLRSIFTHLRVCWDFKNLELFKWLALVLGIGLPGLFLALELAVTGVSYRIAGTCFPNEDHAYETWFGWLIAFAGIAAILQVTTTLFCLWVYLRDLRKGSANRSSGRNSSARHSGVSSETGGSVTATAVSEERRVAWKRVKRVLRLQWRSVVLSCLVCIQTIYFGIVFVLQQISVGGLSAGQQQKVTTWAVCLVLNGGNKNKCPLVTKELGLNEDVIIAALIMPPLVGIAIFFLMIRRSMLTGWWYLIQNPRSLGRRPELSEGDFIAFESPKRKSFGRPLESEKAPTIETTLSGTTVADTTHSSQAHAMTSPMSPVSSSEPGILPEPTSPNSPRNPSVLQAGDATRRHETIKWFDADYKEADSRRVSKLDAIA
ncbi:hypothetical protein DOTSEDRAFT_177259 [Dothistroma septosporum NZE10]|uniref:G-protein coupled receptors family 2 profile 2 domain-containing protein n=1 Tax=Dothistroma septosporum (strain NZE10 / CBS 128990) TaxID=675120 RepID=N1PKN5_DOTSN|nr:hypothetical protein DOTSEDRAFT_177259 [Dothistroma septosporum NZE10]